MTKHDLIRSLNKARISQIEVIEPYNQPKADQVLKAAKAIQKTDPTAAARIRDLSAEKRTATATVRGPHCLTRHPRIAIENLSWMNPKDSFCYVPY